MVIAAFLGSMEHNNAKILLFKLTFTGNYGVNGVGDLVNLAPYEQGSNPNGVTDPSGSYDQILSQPPTIPPGVFTDNLGGSWTNPNPNAAPTLYNLGIRMFEPGGAEKATNAAYTAAELAGYTIIQVAVPAQ